MAQSASEKLAQSSLKAVRAYAKKTTSSSKAARNALVKVGSHTKAGNLSKAYK